MASIREAIAKDEYPRFIRTFMKKMYGGGGRDRGRGSNGDGGGEKEGSDADEYPQWAVDALKAVGVDLTVDS